MANQQQSLGGVPHKDGDGPSPDVERNAADDKPMAGGTVNFDDDDMAYPRGKTTAAGGTRDAQGGDSAPLGPPGAGRSDRNGPSDPDSRRQ